MRLFGFHGRSARPRRPDLISACLPVVQALGEGCCEPPRVEPPCVPAIVEPLEPKLHLSYFTAGISASDAFALSSPYALNLFTTDGTAKQFVVYWNDPNGPTSQTYTNSSGFTNPYSVSHTYVTFGPSAPIKRSPRR